MADGPAGRARGARPGAIRHDKVQRLGVDHFVQTHASAATPRIGARHRARRAVERERVEVAREAGELEDVETVARRQGEAAGQVDPEAAVEARAPADRKRAVLSRCVALKVQAECARGSLRETAGDGKGPLAAGPAGPSANGQAARSRSAPAN